MSKNWVGYIISVTCKDNLGTYQGQISEVTSSTMTLTKVFHNGIPHCGAEVVINATDIEDLQMIDSQPSNTNGHSTVTVAKPQAKRAGRSISMSESTPNNKQTNLQSSSKKQSNEESKANNSLNEATVFKNGNSSRKDKSKMKWKDEACFGNTMDNSMLQDFDFEKNLALFNKEAIWEQLNASQKPDVVHQTDNCKKTQKYRHDENVIATLPTAFRQIIVPAPDTREYVTDDGLIIPSITQELKRQLLAAAERRGLSLDRQVELMGRAATEMALQLLGGGHRLNPHNTHQWPTVVILSGSHRQGAIGLNCARHLASHGVNTVVYTSTPDSDALLRSELSLYKLTNNKMTTSISGLPHTADLIIVALCDDSDNPSTHSQIAAWTNQNRAPVLALDPPPVGTPGIVTKFSLVPVLPLTYSSDNGKLYLCNLGFPLKIFKDVGIKYRSPFGPKFVIPLHPNDT